MWLGVLVGSLIWFAFCILFAFAKRRKGRTKKFRGLPVANRNFLLESKDKALKMAQEYTTKLYGQCLDPLEHPPHHQGQNPHFHVHKHGFFIENDCAVNYHFQWPDSNNGTISTAATIDTNTDTEGESGYESGVETS